MSTLTFSIVGIVLVCLTASIGYAVVATKLDWLNARNNGSYLTNELRIKYYATVVTFLLAVVVDVLILGLYG